ncbi:MAG TPA: asparaginase [Chloroflexi bacterium]|nr:asparaginase [Chloroflexota bacterium]
MSDYLPVFALTRGETVESVHFGAIAICDNRGNLLWHYGNPDTITFLRSTAKPFQALPFVEAGGVEHFGLTARETALICASHSGTDEHVAVAASIQRKAGVTEDDLLCGTHPPYHQETAERLKAAGEEPTPNRHNCSGKHSGMLAFARMIGAPTADYVNPSHPVQQRILHTFAEMCGLAPSQVALGTDGCSAPNFAVPLRSAALAYARLCDPSALPPARAAACRKITAAMTAYPEMVGGPGRFDTALMRLGGGKIVSKAGAEGYQGIGLLPGALGSGSPALGIVFKISDGDARKKARSAVAVEILRQLGALDETQLQALASFGPRFPIHNWRKLQVGEGYPVFAEIDAREQV